MILYGTWIGTWTRKNCLGAAGAIVMGAGSAFVSHGPVRLVASRRDPICQFTSRFEPDFWMVGDGGADKVRMIKQLM